MSIEISKQHCDTLLKLARKCIAEKLGRKAVACSQDKMPELLNDSCLQRHNATFVTLKLNSQLRGCIGNLSPCDTIVEGVARNAVNSAFNDHRFSPLHDAEFDDLLIEISILSQPQPLNYDGGDDLARKLRVGVDGVTITKGESSATFLPQVWEQLPTTDEFLCYLCRKASLPSDIWKTEKLHVETYSVQHFSE